MIVPRHSFNAFRRVAGVTSVQVRYASDKAIRSRMDSVANIKKITKAMKMVASAKLKKCEDALKSSRAFGRGINDIFGEEQLVANSATPAPVAATPTEGTEEGKTIIPNSVLVVPVTPDRGLCGSVSAQVNRASRKRINELVAQNKQVIIVSYGEKNRAALERNFSQYFAASHGEHSKLKRRTFKQTAMIAEQIVKQPFENGEVLYNQFKNMITFESRHVRLPSYQQAIADPKLFEPYEMEGDSDILQNLYEFSIAVKLHTWLAESDMVEFSQRVNSMGNSSKSAEDMLARLSLLYNRTRQAKITTELVEIISGASAADDNKKNE